MKKLLCLLSMAGLGLFSHAQDWKTDDQYIQNFAKYAVEEMELYKIPASIKLAQGILETGGGQSRLAREGKNHFGIKCKENWTGKTMKHTDDAPNECFRVYDDPRESYRDHSLFLTTRKYYVGLFKLDIKDYKGWAYGLKKAGYATNPKYAQILINRIEKYRLHEFDNIKSHEVSAKLKELYPEYKSENQEIRNQESVKEKSTKEEVRTEPVLREEKVKEPVVQKPETKQETEISKPEIESGKKKEPDLHKYEEGRLTEEAVLHSLNERNHPNSNLKYVVLGGDISLSALAKKYNLRVSDLKDYNDLKTSDLKKNQIVFLEPKKSYGSQETHTVRKGEKMYDISQKYGIKLKHLYLKNRKEETQEPKEGQVLYLQNKKPRRER